MTREDEIRDEWINTSTYTDEGAAYQRIVEELLVGNKLLRDALAFYASEKTYQLGVQISMGSAHPLHEPIKYDKGERARQALEGECK